MQSMEGGPAALLAARQTEILRRIDGLAARLASLSSAAPGESSSSSSSAAGASAGAANGVLTEVPDETSPGPESVQARLERDLAARGLSLFRFKRVPGDYYSWALEARRDVLGAPSVSHLCKSIVLKNTQAPADITDCSNPKNSLYYVVVVQYNAKLNTEKVRSFVHGLSQGAIPKKRYNMRLAPEDEANALTGFIYNAVTPVGMRQKVPIILSHLIKQLEPRFFWMGGGEVDLKLGMPVDDFVNSYNPFIVDCT